MYNIQASHHTEQSSLSVKRLVSGKVDCPKLGRIDVECCFYCPEADEIEIDVSRPFVVCSGSLPKSSVEKRVQKEAGVLASAKSIGNVSEACRVWGVSRTYFYHAKKRSKETL